MPRQAERFDALAQAVGVDMLYLLRLKDDGHARQVPLADGTAAALERALVATDDALCVDELTAAIVRDPALAAWIALQAQRQDGAIVTTAAAAASWLGSGLAGKLAATVSSDSAQFGRVPPAEAQSLAALYVSVVLAARTQHAAGDPDVDPAQSAVYWSAVMAANDRLLEAWPLKTQTERRLLPAFSPVELRPTDRPDAKPNANSNELLEFFLAAQPGIEQRLPALMTRLCRYEQQLADFDCRLEREKLAALKELAYGASHEINNPLANIAARAQTLLQDETNPERRRKLAAIHRQAMRAHEMIADLMLFARPPELNLAPCDLGPLAKQVVDELRDLADEREIRLVCDLREPAIVLEADQTQLAVAVQAVVVNSLEAVGAGGHVEVIVRDRQVGSERWAEVVVRDDGPGISDDVRRHMFDPFFSGREAGRGLGFGLSKCWRIVTDHGGHVVVGSSPPGGCEVTMLLPLAPQAAGADDGG